MIHKHRAVIITNSSNKRGFIESLLEGPIPNLFGDLKGQKGALFSKLAVGQFIEEEVRHDRKLLTENTQQSLQSMSSGERKKALLAYVLKTKPQFLILDNPFDNLDVNSREDLKKTLSSLAQDIVLVQLMSRIKDLLPFIDNYFELKGEALVALENLTEIPELNSSLPFMNALPKPLHPMFYKDEFLVRLKDVSVHYGDKAILHNINWDIRPNEFWQLKGINGSGKTTLLSMITGDNPKGYGEELYLFGQRKGSGESIWDIKKKIGYFTPAMIDRFTGYHTLQHMLISGLMDSIGLYIKPTEAQIRLAAAWLKLIGMWHIKDSYFHDLSMGQQRLIMCVRAVIKHPMLLILDEPTAGLDDKSAGLFVALVNKIARESKTAIVFVSHREEPGLKANLEYELIATERGSAGKRQRT